MHSHALYLEQELSAAKVSDFIQTVWILKVRFYAYFMHIRIFRTVSRYVKYCMIGIFGFFTIERQKIVGSTENFTSGTGGAKV